MGSHVNYSLSVCMIDQLQQTVSYKRVLPEGNYTAASITVVDLCGQRSKPSELILTNITMDLLLVSNVPTSDTEQSQVTAIGAGLGVTLGVVTIVMVASIITVIILAFYVHSYRKGAAATYSQQAVSRGVAKIYRKGGLSI